MKAASWAVVVLWGGLLTAQPSIWKGCRRSSRARAAPFPRPRIHNRKAIQMKVCRRILFSFVALSLAITATLTAHTMFLKLETFYLEPHSTNVVQLINGDFDKSENAITRDRMLDVSVVGPDGTTQPPGDAWADSAVYHWNADSVDTALLTFETGSEGTYLLAVSTAPRTFTLAAPEFNEYLVHDGIVDVIAEREAAGTTGNDATERYSKHVKALVQVGEARSAHWSHTMGYPVEFVPPPESIRALRGRRAAGALPSRRPSPSPTSWSTPTTSTITRTTTPAITSRRSRPAPTATASSPFRWRAGAVGTCGRFTWWRRHRSRMLTTSRTGQH